MDKIFFFIFKLIFWPVKLLRILFPNEGGDSLVGTLGFYFVLVPLALFLSIGQFYFYYLLIVSGIGFLKRIFVPKYCEKCGTKLTNDYYDSRMCSSCFLKETEHNKKLVLLSKRQKHQEEIDLAKQYEIVGRFEEAALIYERLAQTTYGDIEPEPKYLEDAGRVRRMARTEYVKSSSVNINTLIPQLKELVNYKCPNCGAAIGINAKTSPEGLKFCSHCGSTLNIDMITNFLRDFL